MARIKAGLVFLAIIILAGITYGQAIDRQADTALVIVDRLAYKAEFSLMWLNNKFSKDDFRFSLRSPSGEIITEEASDPKVEVVNTGLAQAKGFRITEPEAGTWQLIVERPPDADYTTGQIIWSDLKIHLDFLNKSPKINEPIIIVAKIYEPEPVTEANVSVVLKQYKKGSIDYNEFNFMLEDKGMDGDEIAGDGIYTVTFSNTDIEGSYCVYVKAQGYGPKAGEFELNPFQCTYVSDPSARPARINREE